MEGAAYDGDDDQLCPGVSIGDDGQDVDDMSGTFARRASGSHGKASCIRQAGDLKFLAAVFISSGWAFAHFSRLLSSTRATKRSSELTGPEAGLVRALASGKKNSSSSAAITV